MWAERPLPVSCGVRGDKERGNKTVAGRNCTAASAAVSCIAAFEKRRGDGEQRDHPCEEQESCLPGFEYPEACWRRLHQRAGSVVSTGGPLDAQQSRCFAQ